MEEGLVVVGVGVVEWRGRSSRGWVGVGALGMWGVEIRVRVWREVGIRIWKEVGIRVRVWGLEEHVEWR